MSRGAAIDPTLADVERARQRALMIQVAQHGEEDLAELRELLRTDGVAVAGGARPRPAGVAVAGELVQHRDQPNSNTYLGAGKPDELKRAVKASDANLVACDD